jgi:hypothetical protein
MEINATPPKSTVMSLTRDGAVSMWIDGNINNEVVRIDTDAMTLLYTHFDHGKDGEQVLRDVRECLSKWLTQRGHDFQRDGGVHIQKAMAVEILKQVG